MNVPKWLKKYLKPGDINDIQSAIKMAEIGTSGEIVPMIVRRSSTVGHVPALLLCMLVILFFIIDVPFFQNTYISDSAYLYIADIVILIILTNILSHFSLLERLLTSKHDRQLQVDMRAEVEFYEQGLNKTTSATGILLFVSLMEKRAVVLADKAISEKMPKDTWHDVVNLMLNGVKSSQMGKGFSEAIIKCGEILAPHFPIQIDDVNELKNRLVIKE